MPHVIRRAPVNVRTFIGHARRLRQVTLRQSKRTRVSHIMGPTETAVTTDESDPTHTGSALVAVNRKWCPALRLLVGAVRSRRIHQPVWRVRLLYALHSLDSASWGVGSSTVRQKEAESEGLFPGGDSRP